MNLIRNFGNCAPIRVYFIIQGKGKGKGKGKIHLITCHEGTEGKQIYSSTFPLTSALHGVGR